MLTRQEKLAVLNCQYFGSHWGMKDEGLCPMALVAQMRGAVFYDDGPQHGFFYTNESSEIVHQAVEDVANWLGIPPLDIYEVIFKEGRNILKRAPQELETLDDKGEIASAKNSANLLSLSGKSKRTK